MADTTPTFVPEVQLLLGGSWVQIVGASTQDVLARDGLQLTRGRSDWSSQIQPSRATMSIKNPTGVYSPRHPGSVYFGQLGRNIPIKVFMDGACRYHGEVSEWPQRTDPTRYVPIEAAGVLRRLSGSNDPLRSVLYRTMMQDGGLQTPVAYWPCEEESTSTRLYSALPRNKPIRLFTETRLAAYSGIPASAAIPTLGGKHFSGDIAPHSGNATMTAMCLVRLPDGGVAADDAGLMMCTTTGSARFWWVRVNINRTLNVQVLQADGTVIGTTADTSFTVAPEGALVLLELTTSGADITWNLRVLNVGRTAASTFSATMLGKSYGRVPRIFIAPGDDLGDAAVGHVALFTGTVDDDILLDALNAHTGETAGRRIGRLCDEEDVPFDDGGYDLDDTQRMGPQGLKSLLELLTECADADTGILYEPMEMPTGDLPGLGYRPRASLYNTTGTLTLDFDQNQIALPFEPTDDDQLLANDVSVTREGGATFRQQIYDGPLGIDTAQRNRGGGTVNVETDLDAEQLSGWLVHLGTWDESRVPQLTVSLTRNPTLAAAAVAVDMGHRITLTHPPDSLPPDQFELMVQGSTETLDSKTWRIVYNTTPWRAFQVLRLDAGPVKKVSPTDSQLNAGINAAVTSMSVKSVSGRWLWPTGTVSIPIRVDGEVMTVTNISGSSSPQTFTITRGVNGYPAAHSANAPVTLRDRATLGL